MPSLNIPDIHKQGFKYFIGLKKTLRIELIKEIEKAKIGSSPVKLAKELSEKLSIEKSKLDAIIPLVFSLFNAKESMGIGIESFTNLVVEALEQTNDEKLKPTKNVKEQLIQLFSIKGSFYFNFKANNLVSERGKLLYNANIFTDIRPVFGDDQDYEIKCSLILHNMKIEYQEDAEFKEIFFAVNADGLKKLKEIILRAEEKEKAIKKKIKISFLNN